MEEGVRLRLALAGGELGLELAGAVPVLRGLTLEQLSIRLTGVRFPLDLSGGVHRFRHRRGTLAFARAMLLPGQVARELSPQLRDRLGFRACSLELAPMPWGLAVGLLGDESALAFDLVFAPSDGNLRILVERARSLGSTDPPQLLAVRAVAIVLGAMARRVGSGFFLAEPFLHMCRQLLPDAGARVPSAEGLFLDFELDESARFVFDLSGSPASRALSTRAVRALEIAELLAEGDDALVAGQWDGARRNYLAALGRAPRHEEAATRLAALDFAVGGRTEAALSTLVEIGSAAEGGILGSLLLESVGDPEAAYAAAARAAEDESYGALSGRAWLRAALLSADADAQLHALGQAILRAPSLAEARYQRLSLHLRRGDRRAALADAEHIEANLRTPHERHQATRRLAESLLSFGYPREAQAFFERSLRHEPRSVEALAGLARALRGLGRSQRAMDLFARACELAERQKEPRYDLVIELAELLAVFAADRALAVARLASVPEDAPLAPQARLLEARYRADLGDHTGASRTLARLRLLAERSPVPTERAADLAPLLVLAAEIDLEQLRDAPAAERDLVLALRLDPHHREAGAALRRLARGEVATASLDESSSPSWSTELPPAPSVPPPALTEQFEPEASPEEDEALVEKCTDRLRADPLDHENATRLAGALERLGRDLDLLALLSAQIEDAPEELLPPLRVRRRETLLRLAERATEEGRPGEAELYSSMATGDD